MKRLVLAGAGGWWAAGQRLASAAGLRVDRERTERFGGRSLSARRLPAWALVCFKDT